MSKVFLAAFQINNKLDCCWYYLLNLVVSESTNPFSRCSQTHSLVLYSRMNFGENSPQIYPPTVSRIYLSSFLTMRTPATIGHCDRSPFLHGFLRDTSKGSAVVSAKVFQHLEICTSF